MTVRRGLQRRSLDTSSKKSDRLHYMIIAVVFMSAIILCRVFYLQVPKHAVYEALAENQHALEQEIAPERGTIYAQNIAEGGALVPLASNRTYWLLYAVPDDIENASEVADQLIAVLPNLQREEIIAKMTKPDDLYEELATKVEEDAYNKIIEKNLRGIYFTSDRVRYYPEKNIGSHMLGFVGFNGGDEKTGLYGLEGGLQELLAGTKGYVKADQDAAGRWIVIGTQEFDEAEDGTALVLTIDETIQYTACTKLNEAVQKHGADSGSVIIMNPKTGAILAMCGSPDFDPNDYGNVEDIGVYMNQVTSGAYEPGSIFKPITMSMAINEGKVTPQTTYTDTGEVKVGSYTIKNSDNKAHGVQTMTQVLEESLNTGAIFAMQQVGQEMFRDYVYDYGFGNTTGLPIQGESAGNISNLDLQEEIYAMTGSYGQGISVTPIQMVAAYGVLANDGKLMKPFLVQKLLNPDGSTKEETKSEEVRQVVSAETASTIGAMLVNVVENGHGKKAGVPGYYIAGKTGTAQVKSETGAGYDANNTIGSFAGFGPVSDPAFVMLVRIDHPRDVTFAESTAAPLFGDIAKFLLHYLQISPDRVE